jgi:hypothetical protein
MSKLSMLATKERVKKLQKAYMKAPRICNKVENFLQTALGTTIRKSNHEADRMYT